ncbi:collagen-binding domain-containing protein [Sphingomonas sp. RS6]
MVAVPGAASANPLGVYNLLVFGNVNGFNSDVEGSVAIGGSATLTNYSVGLKADGTDTNLVVGGSIQAVNGTTYGNSVIGGASSYTGWTTTGIQYPAGTASPIDFAAEQTRLTSLSTYLSTLAQSGTVTDQWGTLSLTAMSDFNVFDISAATFSGTNTLNINASANSTVVVNIAGAAQAFQNMGISLSGGVTAGNIVYNFYEADQLTISGVGVLGSVLAPNASVLGSSSQILGQLVAANFSGQNGSTTQVNRFDFRGTLPTPTAVPEPASWTMMILGFGAVGAMLRRTGRRRAIA